MELLVLLIAQIALSLISAAIAQATAKRASRTAMSGPGEIKAPIAEHGTPIPVLYGTTRIKGPNVIGKFGDQWFRTNGIYDYYANLQLGLCWGPAVLKSIYLSDTGLASLEPLLKWAPLESWNPIGTTIDLGINWIDSPHYVSVDSGSVVAGEVVVTTDCTSLDLWYEEVGNNEAIYPTGTMVVSYSGGDTRNNSNPPAFGVILSHPTYGRYFASAKIKSGTIAYAVMSAVNRNDHKTIIPAGWIRYDGTFWKAYSPTVPPETKLPKWCETYYVANPDDKAGVKISGDVRFYPGKPDQGVDPFLLDSSGKGPRFPGLCQIVFASGDKRRGYKNGWFYWGQSPTLPQLSYELERIIDPLGLGSAARINSYDANPANILYDLLTNTVYGLRMPISKCDAATFVACGNTLKAEGIGMSLLLDKSASFDAIVSDVIKTIDGALYQDPQTGLWTMSLVRRDYVVADLPVFGPDDYLDAPECVRSMDTANQVSVTYCSREGGYSNRTVRADDACGYQTMGELIQIGNTYQGVTQESTAFKLAARDLRVYSQPIAKITLKLNRRGWKLRPGSPFVSNDSDLGIVGMVCRVATINYGTLDNPAITIEALEDVFGIPLTSYIPPTTTPMDSNKALPSLPSDIALWEVPYPMLGTTEWRQVAALAAPGANASTMEIYTDDAVAGVFANTGIIASSVDGYTPSGQLTVALTGTEERTDSVTLQGLSALDNYELIGGNESGRNLLLVGDELMSFGQLAYNDDDTVTIHDVLRGVLDTIPKAHALGARAWFVRDLAMINGAYTTDGTHNVKVTAGNQAGTIQPGSVPAQSITTNKRQELPYTPGKFRVGAGSTFAQTMTDDRLMDISAGLSVSWEWRNKASQVGIVAQDATGVAVPSGVIHEVWIGTDGFALVPIASPATSPTTITAAQIAYALGIMELETFQVHLIAAHPVGSENNTCYMPRISGTIKPAGYGYGYGENYGGI